MIPLSWREADRLAEWKSTDDLEDHFRSHRRLLRVATLAEYEASASETIEVGTYFEYRDPRTGAWRAGYFDRHTERFAAMNEHGQIVTHFRCRERYVEKLPKSTYA